MKKHGGTGKKMVMVALLAVLLISLGFLSKQVKEGMEKMEEDKLMEEEEKKEDVKEGRRNMSWYTPPPSRRGRNSGAQSIIERAAAKAVARKIGQI